MCLENNLFVKNRYFFLYFINLHIDPSKGKLLIVRSCVYVNKTLFTWVSVAMNEYRNTSSETIIT